MISWDGRPVSTCFGILIDPKIVETQPDFSKQGVPNFFQFAYETCSRPRGIQTSEQTKKLLLFAFVLFGNEVL